MNKFNKIYQCFLDLIVHEVVIQKKSDTFFQHKLMDSVHLKSVRGIYMLGGPSPDPPITR